MVLVGDEGRDVREKYANVNRQRERERKRGMCAFARACPIFISSPPLFPVVVCPCLVDVR